MPYKVVSRDGKHCVVRKADGSTVSCHESQTEANKHMAALYTNVREARSFEQLSEAVYQVLRNRLGSSWSEGGSSWRIVATFPDEVIVQRGFALESYPITETGADVQLGEPKPVELIYRALKEASDGTFLGPIEEASKEQPGSKWLVCAISEGVSKNRTIYSADVLREAAPLYEGAKVFYDHSKKGATSRDPRDLAGFLSGARFGVVAPESSKGATKAMVLATLTATSAQLREQLLESYTAGRPDLLGLSHTAHCEAERVKLADGPATRVKKIRAVESVDVVSFPSAGGRVMRLVAGLSSPVAETAEDLAMLERKLTKLKESRPELYARLGAEPTETEVDALLLEAMTPAAAAPPPAGPNADLLRLLAAALGAQAPAAAAAPAQVLSEADRRTLHEAKVDRLLKGRTMKPVIFDTLRESLYSRVGATESELQAEVERAVKLAGKLSASEQRFGSGQGTTVESVVDEADKVLEGMDGFFMKDASPEVRAEYKKLTGHDAPREGFKSIRRLYEAVTGDEDVTGYIKEAVGLARFRRILESIQTSSFTNLLGDSITRRMLSEYRATDYSTRWRRICSRIGGVNDFRTQERLRWGSFPDLVTIAQLQPYPEMANPTDEKISYAAAKRGGIVSISREAVKNDDVGFVRELPQKIAFAAARTLHKFVFDLILTNPTLDDGSALFLASTARGFSSAGNIQTAALSTTTVNVARQRLLKVRDRDSNTVLGLSPKILIVPPELEEIGYRLTSIPVYPVSAQTATEPNFFAQRLGMNELIVLETMTDLNDYFILADPNLVNTIEMGFLDDQQEPALFTQDREDTGSVFSADKLSWKVRHEYGGEIMDWRGMQGGIVP